MNAALPLIVLSLVSLSAVLLAGEASPVHSAIAVALIGVVAASAVEISTGSAGWPTVFEIEPGSSHVVSRTVDGKSRTWTVKLVEVTTAAQPLCFTKEPAADQFVAAAVTVEVNGTRGVLLHRAYALPLTIAGLRLYVECLPRWSQVGYAKMVPAPKGIRFSACAADGTWGPADLRFPIRNYRWRANPYVNTWMSVVPQPSQLYYHKGEDFGAIPDELPVIACLDARVATSPLPGGDDKSNSIHLDFSSGYCARYSHLNIEHIAATALPGATLRSGAAFARTGSTWNGGRNQKTDPHLHFGLYCGDVAISAYPMIVESYLRDYDDPGLAVAGGYIFGIAGTPLTLDATRSLARQGRHIAAYEWKLCDGKVSAMPELTHTYASPGYYAEELTVTFDDGSKARDIAQVRVFASDGQPASGFSGWIHHTPVRGIVPGTEVTFQKALWTALADARIDFGDGTPPVPCEQSATHRYAKPGLYTVTIARPDKHRWVKTVVVLEDLRPRQMHPGVGSGPSFLPAPPGRQDGTRAQPWREGD